MLNGMGSRGLNLVMPLEFTKSDRNLLLTENNPINSLEFFQANHAFQHTDDANLYLLICLSGTVRIRFLLK